MTLVPDRAWHIAKEYGSLDYTGAVVLDIGAEYGCTAEFFLSRGAASVIACESNPEWRARLSGWAKGRPVSVYGEVTAENAARLFDVQPDIVKVDCEGCERHLLSLPDVTLGSPRSWVIETHTLELHKAFDALFRRLGYTVHMVCDFGDTPNRAGQVCKVFTAERK